MTNFEKFDLGRVREGSTFSTTLHLLTPHMQEWIRQTPDRLRLRRFACACTRALAALCPFVPDPAMRTIALAERYCAEQATDAELEAAYAGMSGLVQDTFERYRAAQQRLDAHQATLDDCLAADLAHRSTLAARACVLRSAPVAAAETIFEYTNVMTRRRTHAVQGEFLGRAGQLLDRQAPWVIEEQDQLLQSYLRDLPRPFTARLQQAGDAALRRFACSCATDAIECAARRLEHLGERADFSGLGQVVEVGLRHAAGQATAAELKAALEAGLQMARDWYRQEDLLRDQEPKRSNAAAAAGILAETADCVYVCAEPSARLAAVKALRVALHVLSTTDTAAVIHQLAERYLGPPPPPPADV